MKLIWHARTKTDPIDARKLAELARVHLLPAIWIPDPATRAQRQLLRGRASLVRQRTVLKNRIHAYLTAENLRSPAVDLYGRAGRAWLATVVLPRLCAATSISCSPTSISSPRRSSRSTSISNVTLGRMPSPSGCKRFLALSPSAPSCSKRRSGPFHSAQELAADAGLVPSTHSSRGKTHHGAVAAAVPGSSGSSSKSFRHTNWRLAPWDSTIKSC